MSNARTTQSRRTGLTIRALIAAPVALCLALPGMAAAQGRTVHAVVFVDLIPSDQATGSAMLAGYARRARQDPAVRSVALVEETRIPNHYMLEETFVSEAAYRRFVQEPYVCEFRAALYSRLGSPWDERIGTEVSP